MKVGLIGVGRAGGEIVDALHAVSAEGVPVVEGAVAVDTDDEDLRDLEHVPTENRHLLGGIETNGTGTAGNQDLAVDVAADSDAELRAALDAIPVSRVDAIVLVAGLSGGTGGGMGPCVAELLAEVVAQPMYAVGVLPSDADDEAGARAVNAFRSLRALRETTDDVLLVDIEQWRGSGQSVEEAYPALDADVAAALWALFAAGEVDGSAPTPERTLDASEIVNTLTGDGLAAIARAENDLPDDDAGDDGILGTVQRLLGDSTPDVDAVTATRLVTTSVREALHTGTSLRCELGGIGRAAVVVDGPAPYLLREGIEEATTLLEDETGAVAVRVGDRPNPGADRLGVTLLLSGISESPRLDELERAAQAAREAAADTTSDSPGTDAVTDPTNDEPE